MRVDITQFPETITSLKSGEQLTIGDLHANALKFIYILVQKGIMKIDKDNYKKLVSTYEKFETLCNAIATRRVSFDKSGRKKPFGKEVLTENEKTRLARYAGQFSAILESTTFTSHKNLVRLIGDEVCDRSGSDAFVLMILQKLNVAKIPVNILSSNHGNEFLQAFENDFKCFKSKRVHMYGQDSSLVNLGLLVEADVITKDKLIELVKTVYLPTLRLIDYSIDKENNRITLYTHAPVGLETIEALAKKFKVAYSDESVTSLADTIEKINCAFAYKVATKKVCEFSDINAIDKTQITDIDTDHPLVRVMWHRGYKDCDLPTTKNGYKLHYVHGHHGHGEVPEAYKSFIFSCDNVLGKGPGSTKGNYDTTQLVTSGKALAGSRYFIMNVERAIVLNEWKVGPGTQNSFGGKSIQIDPKTKKKVPTHVAKIFETIARSKSEKGSVDQLASEIKEISRKAKSKFGFFRHKETQDIYSSWADGVGNSVTLKSFSS